MIRNARILALAAASLSVVARSSLSHDMIVNVITPSIYNGITSKMDLSLGISDYIVEDFEDSMLQPGLSITQMGTFEGPEEYPITITSDHLLVPPLIRPWVAP